MPSPPRKTEALLLGGVGEEGTGTRRLAGQEGPYLSGQISFILSY